MRAAVIFIFLFLTATVLPQEKRYFDVPFGGGGGYIPAWYTTNLDPVNSQLTEIGIPELNNGVYSSGGGGFLYIGFVPGLRLGGMGFGGYTSSENVNNGVKQEARYSFGGGGLTVEYTVPFIKGFGVSFGALIGAGTQSVEIYKSSGTFNWDDVWEQYGSNGNTGDYSRILENNYWILSPTLNIDIPFYRFFVFRIGAGYTFSMGNDWHVENEQSISGVPTDLKGDNFYIQSGIFIGFFSF